MFSSTPALLLFNLAVANVMADVDLQAPVSPAIDLPLANALQNVDRKVPLAEANGLAQVPLVRVAELQPPAPLENVARQFVAERSPREIRPPDRLFDRYTSSNIDGHKRTSSARKAQRATRLAIRESRQPRALPRAPLQASGTTITISTNAAIRAHRYIRCAKFENLMIFSF